MGMRIGMNAGRSRAHQSLGKSMIKPTCTTALLLPLLLLSAACDSIHEVSRRAPVDAVSLQKQDAKRCILNTLEQNSELSDIRTETIPPKSSWSLYQGRENTPAYVHYLFETKLGTGGLYAAPRPSLKDQELKAYFVKMNEEFSKEEAAEAQRIVDKVTNSVIERCVTE